MMTNDEKAMIAGAQSKMRLDPVLRQVIRELQSTVELAQESTDRAVNAFAFCIAGRMASLLYDPTAELTPPYSDDELEVMAQMLLEVYKTPDEENPVTQ